MLFRHFDVHFFFLSKTFEPVVFLAFPRVGWVLTEYSLESDRSSQLHSLAPYCAEHISVKATIPPIPIILCSPFGKGPPIRDE